MATPNYGYEKRQKELAKKRKKEDKLKAKSERKLGELGHADDLQASDADHLDPAAPAGDAQTPSTPT